MRKDQLRRSFNHHCKKKKEAIEKYGPTSIGISQGTGRGYNRYTFRFARSIGTPNIFLPNAVPTYNSRIDSRGGL
ncbi:MAG: hypothetical protein ACE5R6_03400 [Candidatus Heimdallarchaeota archaeon]